MTDIDYPTFDNHGAVINLQAFPGVVKISGSTFKKNIAFIPEIYPAMRSQYDEIDFLLDYQNTVTG